MTRANNQQSIVLQLSDLPAPPENRTGWPWDTEVEPAANRDQTDLPKISIVTPSFNQGMFIEETIRSVLLQGYPNLEYLVMDGGSTDDTTEILEKYSPWLTYWQSEPDGGLSPAVNMGWERSTGEILGWANSDDIYLPGALDLAANEYRREKFSILAGATKFTDEFGNTTSIKLGSFAPADLIGGTKPGQIATFYSRDAMDEVGGLRTDLYYCIDREYVMRYSEKYYPDRTRTVDQLAAAFRVWDDTKTSTGRSEAFIERKDVAFQFIDRVIPIEERSKYRRLALKKLRSDQLLREQALGNRWTVIRYSILIVIAGRTLPGIKGVLNFTKYLFFKSR
jgi:glycosyltransferase involved in cell wall biosynthesis